MTVIIASALQVLAFIVRHWKLVVIVAALGGMGYEGFHLARAWDKQQALVAETQMLVNRLNTVSAINKAYNDKFAADQEELNKLRDLARETPANGSGCLPVDAARRVRAIGQPKGKR